MLANKERKEGTSCRLFLRMKERRLDYCMNLREKEQSSNPRWASCGIYTEEKEEIRS
jgi:hypothetical protein